MPPIYITPTGDLLDRRAFLRRAAHQSIERTYRVQKAAGASLPTWAATTLPPRSGGGSAQGVV